MTACRAGCGSCCNPVVLAYTPDDVRRAPPGVLSERTRQWVLEDLTMIRPRRAGIRRAPWVTQGGMTYVGHPGTSEVAVLISHFYECRHFDPDTRTCGDYDNRPDECRDYPWNDGRPDPKLAFPAWCSYQADLGNEPEPVPVTITERTP